jgi:hypothetical protein
MVWTTGCSAGDERDDLRTIRQALGRRTAAAGFVDFDLTTASTAYQPVVHFRRRRGTLDAGEDCVGRASTTDKTRLRIPAITIF